MSMLPEYTLVMFTLTALFLAALRQRSSQGAAQFGEGVLTLHSKQAI